MGDSASSPAPRWALGSNGQLVHATLLSFAVVTHFIVGFVVVGPALGLTMATIFDGSVAAILMTLAQGAWGLGVVIGLGLLVLGKVTMRGLGWDPRNLRRDVPLGLLGALLLVLLVMGPMVAMGKVSIAEITSAIAGFTAGQRAQILLIGVLAAVIEETVFRGYLLPGLAARIGFPAGLLVSAIIFGAYHFPMGIPIPALVAKVLSGLVLGGLKGPRGTLIAPAVAHFTFWQMMGFA